MRTQPTRDRRPRVIVTDLSLCGDSACPPRGHCSWICLRHTRVRVKRAPWWRVHARVRVQARAGRREKRCRAAGRAPQPASRGGILAAPRTRKGKEEEGASSTSVRIELPGDACTSIAVSLHSIVWESVPQPAVDAAVATKTSSWGRTVGRKAGTVCRDQGAPARRGIGGWRRTARTRSSLP